MAYRAICAASAASTARRTFEPPFGATVSGFPPSDCSSTTFLGDGEAKHFYKRLGFRGFTDVMAMFEPTKLYDQA